MNIKKKILPAVTLAILGTSILGVTKVHAQTNNNFFSGLIQFLSQKFGLDKNQVQTAVNDYHAQNLQKRDQNRQDTEQTYLDGLVKQGKITSDQEKAILVELASLKSKYNPANLKNLSFSDRQKQKQQEQTELKTWATANNIDINLIMPRFGLFKNEGRHKGWFMNITPTPTAQ